MVVLARATPSVRAVLFVPFCNIPRRQRVTATRRYYWTMPMDASLESVRGLTATEHVQYAVTLVRQFPRPQSSSYLRGQSSAFITHASSSEESSATYFNSAFIFSPGYKITFSHKVGVGDESIPTNRYETLRASSARGACVLSLSALRHARLSADLKAAAPHFRGWSGKPQSG
eukprot:6183313-Pleurochrysis_carterae.AAC.8